MYLCAPWQAYARARHGAYVLHTSLLARGAHRGKMTNVQLRRMTDHGELVPVKGSWKLSKASIIALRTHTHICAKRDIYMDERC